MTRTTRTTRRTRRIGSAAAPARRRQQATRWRALPCCLLLVAAAAPALAAREATPLATLVAQLREANYAADAAAAERLLPQLRELAADTSRSDRAQAYYQAATASMLLASFVGPGSLANPAGDAAAMLRHMQESAEDLERAVALAPDLADAHAALASNYGMRTGLERERAAELGAKANTARERALALAPRNPRVVAAHAGFLFWAPPQIGGDRARGLARYAEALALFAAEPAAERDAHAWGEPDAWAILAFARLTPPDPDVAGARAAAEKALALRPDFAWARGALLPRIEQAATAASGNGR